VWLALVEIIHAVLSIYGYLLVAAAVVTWIPDMTHSQLGYVLRRLTDPYLNLFRRFIPSVNVGGVMLDLGFFVGVILYFGLFLRLIMYVLWQVV